MGPCVRLQIKKGTPCNANSRILHFRRRALVRESFAQEERNVSFQTKDALLTGRSFHESVVALEL